QPVAPVRLTLERLATRRVAEMLLQLGAGRPLDQPLAQPIDQPLRAGQLLRPLILPEQLIDQLVRDLDVAHHGPPSGPSGGIAPTAATPRSSRPRRTNQSDTQKSAHYPRARSIRRGCACSPSSDSRLPGAGPARVPARPAAACPADGRRSSSGGGRARGASAKASPAGRAASARAAAPGRVP